MIVYSVQVQVQHEHSQNLEEFFLSQHLRDVYDTGYFTHLSFRKLHENDSETQTFVTEYYCKTLAHLEKYKKLAFPKLKKDVLDRFAGKITVARALYKELKHLPS